MLYLALCLCRRSRTDKNQTELVSVSVTMFDQRIAESIFARCLVRVLQWRPRHRWFAGLRRQRIAE